MHRLVTFLPLLALGCVENDLVMMDVTDVFYQKPPDSVDILLVIDNSGSMKSYQRQLSTNFDEFISYFSQADINYQIAAITTDIESRTAGQILEGTIISPDTPDGATTFERIVQVGVQGSSMESGLEAAYEALTEPLVSNQNAGFLRDDAYLALIFVSDEEDSSPMPVNDYINGFFQVKGQRARDVFTSSALCVIDMADCAGVTDYGEVGSRYIDMATQTGGVLGNICADDFAPVVTDLSLNASRLQGTYYLSELPSVDSLQVSVDETEIACDEGKWRYDLLDYEGTPTGTVLFDLGWLPPSNSQIAVRYNIGDGDPTGFCGGTDTKSGKGGAR
jgi:hypothetical protein